MVVVEPKPKKEYKTKNEKENYVVVEELIALRGPWLVKNFVMKRLKAIETWWRKLRKPLHAKVRRRQRGKMRQTLTEQKPMKGFFRPSPKGGEKPKASVGLLVKIPKTPKKN
jgi:hypothetical protein